MIYIYVSLKKFSMTRDNFVSWFSDCCVCWLPCDWLLRVWLYIQRWFWRHLHSSAGWFCVCNTAWSGSQVSTVKCHYNACHCNANASLTRSILGSQTAPTSWHALMTVPEWLSTWAKGVKSSRSDRPQRQWHLFVPIQLEQNKRIPPAGHVKTVDSWLIFDQTHWLFISDALRMPPFGQYGC